MSSQAKYQIREDTCAKFNLEQLKLAREVLYKTCDPEVHYSYNGPHISKTTERERMNDAFDGIFSKLVKLDADNQMPSFAVPSMELLSLLKISEDQGNHSTCAQKFNRMEEEMGELKKTFHTFVSVVTSSDNKGASAVPPATRNRLLSSSSVKRGADEVDDEEDIHSYSEAEGEKETPFGYQRHQRQKQVKRAKLNNTQPQAQPQVKQDTYSGIASKNPKPKPPSTWGTAKPTNNFKGAVPEIFMYGCDADTLPNEIVEYYKGHNIVIRKIEKKSHELAARKSFQISPATKEDFEKLLNRPEFEVY